MKLLNDFQYKIVCIIWVIYFICYIILRFFIFKVYDQNLIWDLLTIPFPLFVIYQLIDIFTILIRINKV